jgi:upstream-binding transcription factor
MQLVGQEKREAEALKLLHEEQSKKQGQELLEQYLAYKKEAEDAEGNGKKKRKEKDPLKPKHPTTAFFAFCNSRRPALLEAKTRIPEVCLPPALLTPQRMESCWMHESNINAYDRTLWFT